MESNKQNRTLTYERMHRVLFLLFIPLLLAPIVGFWLFQSGWWMFFSCLVVYLFQCMLWPYLTTMSMKESITINVDEIELYANKEKKMIFLHRGLYAIIAILNLYPLFSMSETIMGVFYEEGVYMKTYEGGLLVFILTLLMLLINILAIITASETTNIFEIKNKFQKTGLTPDEQLEKKKKIAVRIEENKLREEKEKYGENYKIIDRGMKLYLNENLKKIYLYGEEYNFCDILSFSAQDNERTIYSGYTSTAKTNNGSMLGRAAVGRLVAGNIGTVIGGATASKTIETSGSTSIIVHNYSIVVTVNSLSSPMVTLKIGEDQNLMNKVSSILTVIVKRNK